MPLYKGNTKIGAIYKGTTPISAIYKGSTLIFSSYTWQEWYVEYIYNTLVPTTINSKNVLDKAKVSTIYGNSVVENQLLGSRNETITRNGITYTYSTDGSVTIQGTATAYSYCYLGTSDSNYVPYTANHIYLCSANITGTISGGYRFSFLDLSNVQNKVRILTPTSSGTGRNFVSFETGAVVNCVIKPTITDLTKRYPFNTPTTLTDVRVQAIINRGYIPYNTGALKNVDMSEVSSNSANLFDQQLEQGGISSSGGVETVVPFRCRNVGYLPIDSTKPLWFNCVSDTYQYALVAFYDSSKNYINYIDLYNKTLPYQVSVPSNTKYIRFGTRRIDNNNCSPSDFANVNMYVGYTNQYTNYTTFTPLSLKYQGSGVNTAHDTMVIDNDNVVFTKNMNEYTFTGNETNQFIYDSNYHRFFFSGLDSVCYLVASASTLGNAMCELYQTAKQANLIDHSLMLYSSATNKIVFRDTNYSSVKTFLQHITNMKLTYQLATPQVITIPRKNIGVVDLGSLANWNYDSTNHRVYAPLTNLKLGTLRRIAMYCNRYMTIQNGESLSQVGNMSIYGAGDTAVVYIHDTELENLTSSQIQEKLLGQYLYFNTQNESTIPNIIGVQGGGTITTNSEVLPNIDFEVKAK